MTTINNAVDIKLISTDNEIPDLEFDSDGDFLLTNGFDSSLQVSLFADARARADEVSAPQLRRGWWGNIFLDVEIGSKLWFLDQAVNNSGRLAQAINFARLSLEWLITRQYADNVVVEGTQDEIKINLDVTIFKNGSIISERNYNLWINTL